MGDTMGFLIRVVVNAFAIWVVTLIPWLMVSVIPFAPGETLQLVLTLLIVAAIFALVNTIVGTVVRIVAIPLYILTLGLFGLIVNGIMFAVVAWLSDLAGFGLQIDGFWWGVLAALVMSILSGIMNGLLGTNRTRDRDR